jgi:ubiquitin carboxyl-terminal hydrolase 16
MSFLERLIDPRAPAVRITKEEYINRVATGNLHYLYLKHWKLSSQSHRLRMLLVASVTAITLYIISPSISWYFTSEEERQRMFSSRRSDKHTTGLINTRNDCFANSALQAFAALPGLTIYLNDIHKQRKLLTSLPLPHEAEEIPALPLHAALADIAKQLQEPIQTARYISVWPFLQVIEKIFNSKISTNQNDAQELVQLIVETLGNERTKLKKFVKKHSLNVMIPEIPFDGLLADQLTCYSCLNSSRPSFHPFSILSLPVPQERTCTLNDMIKANEVETINGYHCLRCKVKAILQVENQKLENGVKLNEVEAQLISKLKVMEPNLTINDDLEEPMESFVKNYKFEAFKTENLLSTIVKKTLIVKAPSLLTLHLSRSMFTANHITRNGCRVEFDDILEMNIDGVLAQEYDSRKKAAKKNEKPLINGDPQEDDNATHEEDDDAVEGYDDDRYEPNELKKIHSKILTEHDEESIHVEDSKKHGTEHVERTSSSEEQASIESNSDDAPDEASLTSDEETATEPLNSTRGNVRYKMRAMVRHHGTHNAGHYECYRHKPMLLKDPVTGSVINMDPKIQWDEEVNEEDKPLEQPKPQSTKASFLASESASRGSETMESDDDGSHFNKFRSRLGSLVSRRSSASSSPSGSGHRSSTLGPSHVDDIAEDVQQLNIHDHQRQSTPDSKKLKKISSVTKYPFWRISDSNISEVKKSDVLKERCAVYMIYYEMIKD